MLPDLNFYWWTPLPSEIFPLVLFVLNNSESAQSCSVSRGRHCFFLFIGLIVRRNLSFPSLNCYWQPLACRRRIWVISISPFPPSMVCFRSSICFPFDLCFIRHSTDYLGSTCGTSSLL